MKFEKLSFRQKIHLKDVPHRWIPLIHLYDPDLPLFPIYYFHTLREGLRPEDAILPKDRAYGFVERIRIFDSGGIDAEIITNKDLSLPENKDFVKPVEDEIRERFGINDPVQLNNITNAFEAPNEQANEVLGKMWQRVVANAYGNLLPFGRLWDEVLGLARFVASWNPPAGRKSELIMTHYFLTRFGEPIEISENIPQVDFHLLPTIKELLNQNDELVDFKTFRDVIKVAELFATHHGTQIAIDDIKLTRFVNPFKGSFNTESLFKIFNGGKIPANLRHTAVECFNAFDKGPPRTVLFLIMLHDLRKGLINPGDLTSAQSGSIYDGLKKISSYQSPKVIEIYAQQCFGNTEAMPVDTWINTFLMWPLKVFPVVRSKTPYTDIFSNAEGLGKVERLLWVTAQARKVHSSACDDAVWCIKNGSPEDGPRGANPFSCNICLESIRKSCPAFAAIASQVVGFNKQTPSANFQITTTGKNNKTPGQSFLLCTGHSIYGDIRDQFSPDDSPSGFSSYPAEKHDGSPMTVAEFVDRY